MLILIVGVVVLIASTVIIVSTEQENGWHTAKAPWVYFSDTPKAGGYGEAVVGDGTYLYILREYSALYAPEFWRYDPASGTLTYLNSSLPAGTFKNGVAMAYDYNGNIYALTGSAYDDGAERVQFYRYNITTDTWTRLADTPHVQGAGDAIVYCGYDNKIYAFLGRAHYLGNYTPPEYSVFARYDPVTDTWENLTFPPWPGTDDGASLAWTGGRYIYALEGEFYENLPIRAFARYDIDFDVWDNVSFIPAPDGVGDGGSLLWIGYYDSAYADMIFALDGNGCNETPGYNFTVYYTNNDTWAHLDSLPAPVGYYVGSRLAYAGGKIYYWQGTPSTWTGNGTKIYSWTPTVPVVEMPVNAMSGVIFLIATVIVIKKYRD